MRIKIKGDITAERLAEALQAATEKFEAARPGSKVYGANLYLTAYDADGLPFDLVDHRGEPLWINIAAKSGELVRPALSADGEERRQKAKDEAKRLTEEAEAKEKAEYEQVVAKLKQKRQEQQEKEAVAKASFELAQYHHCRTPGALSRALHQRIKRSRASSLGRTQTSWNPR